MQQATIFDFDGTLANVQAIRHYVVAPDPVGQWKANFDAFHRAACSAFTEPNWEVLEALKADAARSDRAVILVSARIDKWRVPSLRWLKSYCDDQILWDAVKFRGLNDYRKDVEVKRDIYLQLMDEGYEIVEAWDDNPSIVELWHELEVPKVNVVPGWDLDFRKELV